MITRTISRWALRMAALWAVKTLAQMVMDSPRPRKTRRSSSPAARDSDARDNTLIHVERWRATDFSPPRERRALRAPPSVRTLRPLLRGELRLGAHVVRVSPAERLVELADGHRYVYDKLVSTLSLAAIEFLIAADLPRHVCRDESLRYWLSEHDIEVADRAIQEYYGDLDDFAAGKRVADQVGQALAAKFDNTRRSKMSGIRLFQPRLVTV